MAAVGKPIHVVVTGLMGVGKSTVADAVAAALGRRHRDSDDDLHRLFTQTGAQLAADHGVEELHRLEGRSPARSAGRERAAGGVGGSIGRRRPVVPPGHGQTGDGCRADGTRQ